MAKKQLVNKAPFKKNLPTAPSFIVKDDRNFEEEKIQIIDLVVRFSKESEQALETRINPFVDKTNSRRMEHPSLEAP